MAFFDEPRVGAPRTVSDAQVEEVVTKTLEETPRGETHWSRRSMARAVGLSADTIGRIWLAFGLKPHLVESFKLHGATRDSSARALGQQAKRRIAR